jgi:hypothetical protein
MQYMLLIYGDEKGLTSMPEAQMKSMYAAYGAFTQELVGAGVMKGGSELAPIANASTVRVRNGKTVTTDGPFAETKEQLGGYYLSRRAEPRRSDQMGGEDSVGAVRLDRSPPAGVGNGVRHR